MDRRQFLRGSAGAALAAAVAGCGSTSDLTGPPTRKTVPPTSAPPTTTAGPSYTGATRTFGGTTVRQRVAASDAPNVVFISIDDMNDWAGYLNNHPGTHTPNLDALAAESIDFQKAYCPAPMCLPARNAVMFGMQPDTANVYDHTPDSLNEYRRWSPNTVSLLDHIWAAGYHTMSAGKIFHDVKSDRFDDHEIVVKYLPGYSRPLPTPSPLFTFDPMWDSPYGDGAIDGSIDFPTSKIDFGPSGLPPEEDPDGLIVEFAKRKLNETHSQPFFLAPGFYLPHLPWRVPQRYLDLHPLEEIEVPAFRPDDLDDLSDAAKFNIDRFNIFETLRASGLWEEAVQAYQASISYVDDRIGQLMNELADSPYADDTVVTVWSDHGFHMGEKLHIRKFTLWERSTRVPMLLKLPAGESANGSTIDAPVALTDLSATVAELCGAELPGDYESDSLTPIIADPAVADDRPPVTTWKPGNYAVRRGDYRYIRYADGSQELYDHRVDLDEYNNLAVDATAEVNAAMDELDAFLPPPE